MEAIFADSVPTGSRSGIYTLECVVVPFAFYLADYPFLDKNILQLLCQIARFLSVCCAHITCEPPITEHFDRIRPRNEWESQNIDSWNSCAGFGWFLDGWMGEVRGGVKTCGWVGMGQGVTEFIYVPKPCGRQTLRSFFWWWWRKPLPHTPSHLSPPFSQVFFGTFGTKRIFPFQRAMVNGG